ncbi:sensor domain-containing diguanylate cyclase [Paludisphaera soli]|uniref:sensor domain-containing diguanylate cyclase n=1 Tax=Paludisphaera soli TaxID=2712865 RepID=UPI0013E9CD46|nr:diguanylate cyclase [Paludisphaera soli]
MTEPRVQITNRKPVRWLDRQQQALADISRLWREYGGDLERTIRGVTEATSSALGIARVSFWRYNRAKRTIVCEDLYESESKRHSSGMRLPAGRSPAYFKALESEEVIAAVDARADPRTFEFADSYLGPLGIGALLDAPVRVDGRLAGVLCLEHVGGVREFRDDEVRMTTYLADMIGAFLTVGDWCGGQTGRGRAFGQLLAAGEKLEELIRDEMAVWRILFEQSRDGIVVLDMDGRVVAANKMYSQLLGYSEDEIHELSVWDWDLVFERKQVREKLRSVNASGDHFESRHRRKDGTVIDVEISTNGALFKNRKLIFCFVRDVTERKRVEERLRVLATTDGLTGVANRVECSRRLAGDLERARRYDSPFSLILFDLDHFKQVNDNHGHDAGDRVLQSCARLVVDSIRRVDVAGRWGGEEFLVLLPHSRLDAAANVAEKIRQAIAQHRFDEVGSVTASLGVAEFSRQDDSKSLLRRADEALYRAKARGRNCVEVAPAKERDLRWFAS